MFNLGTCEGSSVLEVIAAFGGSATSRSPVQLNRAASGICALAEFFANPSKANDVLAGRVRADLRTLEVVRGRCLAVASKYPDLGLTS